jgi:hypothetical protein
MQKQNLINTKFRLQERRLAKYMHSHIKHSASSIVKFVQCESRTISIPLLLGCGREAEGFRVHCRLWALLICPNHSVTPALSFLTKIEHSDTPKTSVLKKKSGKEPGIHLPGSLLARQQVGRWQPEY